MKKTNWILVVVVAVVAVVYFWLGKDPISYISLDKSSPSPSSSASSTKPKSTTTTKTTPMPSSASAAANPKTYTDIVKEYADRRIQFDERCQTTPRTSTFKNNSNILLDNRSSTAKVITVGGVKHSLSGYGYKVITLSSPTLPRDISLDCGSAYNVGKILLQAKIY